MRYGFPDRGGGMLIRRQKEAGETARLKPGQLVLAIAAVFAVVVAMLAAPDAARAQDGSDSSAVANGAPTPERPEIGAEGTGDYALYTSRFSIVDPPRDVAGLWTLYRVTQLFCRAVFRGEKSVIEAAPKGFKIERSDVHALGFKRDNWNDDWFAITITGDSERDAAGGHPYWEVRYDRDGNLSECAVTIGSLTEDTDTTISDEEQERLLLFMYVTLPQLLFAVILEPHHAGTYPFSPSDAIKMAVPCRGSWCEITTLYDFRSNSFYVSSTISFKPSMKVE